MRSFSGYTSELMRSCGTKNCLDQLPHAGRPCGDPGAARLRGRRSSSRWRASSRTGVPNRRVTPVNNPDRRQVVRLPWSAGIVGVQVIVLQAVRHRRCGQLSAPVVVGGEQALEGGGFLTSQPAILGGTGSEFVEQPPVLQGQLRGDPGESQWSRGGVCSWPGRAAPRRIEAAVAPERQLLWPWGWLSRCPRTVAVIVGYARDRLPHAERAEARGRFILDHDPAAAPQSDGPQLTATNQPPHELSR